MGVNVCVNLSKKYFCINIYKPMASYILKGKVFKKNKMHKKHKNKPSDCIIQTFLNCTDIHVKPSFLKLLLITILQQSPNVWTVLNCTADPFTYSLTYS